MKDECRIVPSNPVMPRPDARPKVGSSSRGPNPTQRLTKLQARAKGQRTKDSARPGCIHGLALDEPARSGYFVHRLSRHWHISDLEIASDSSASPAAQPRIGGDSAGLQADCAFLGPRPGGDRSLGRISSYCKDVSAVIRGSGRKRDPKRADRPILGRNRARGRPTQLLPASRRVVRFHSRRRDGTHPRGAGFAQRSRFALPRNRSFYPRGALRPGMATAPAGSISRATSPCSKEWREFARKWPSPASAPSSRPRAIRSTLSIYTPRERSSSPMRPSHVRTRAPRFKRRKKSGFRPTRNPVSPDCPARPGNMRLSGGRAWLPKIPRVLDRRPRRGRRSKSAIRWSDLFNTQRRARRDRPRTRMLCRQRRRRPGTGIGPSSICRRSRVSPKSRCRTCRLTARTCRRRSSRCPKAP